jgi:cation transport regulator ChaC
MFLFFMNLVFLYESTLEDQRGVFVYTFLSFLYNPKTFFAHSFFCALDTAFRCFIINNAYVCATPSEAGITILEVEGML